MITTGSGAGRSRTSSAAGFFHSHLPASQGELHAFLRSDEEWREMRRVLGFPVLGAGILFAVYTWHPTFSDETAVLTQTPFMDWRGPHPANVTVETPRHRTFAPGPNFLAAVAARRATPSVATTAPKHDRKTLTLVSATHTPTISPWRTAVIPVPGLAADSAASPQRRTGTYELAREIQRELKRVGCYGGEIDGSWGAGSKRALGAFLERVNASLPTAEPDHFLLFLIKGERAATCGEACPQGQASTRDGRCVPSTILAHVTKKGTHPGSAPAGMQFAWTTEVRPSTLLLAPTQPLAGRMSLGAPRPPDTTEDRSGIKTAVLTGLPEGTEGSLDPDAAIDPGDAESRASLARAATAVEQPAVAARPAASGRPAERRTTSTYRSRSYGQRSVQTLFLHPLGRM
jgi:hypothetical protein